MVQDFKRKDYGNFQRKLDDLIKDGRLDRVLTAFEGIPAKLDDLAAAAKGKGIDKALGI